MAVVLSDEHLKKFIQPSELDYIEPQIVAAHQKLNSWASNGENFTGWLNLPKIYNKTELDSLKKAAKKIISDSDVLLVIGIGGSYIGAKAAIDFLKSQNYNVLAKNTPEIYFVGNSISAVEMINIMEICKDKDVSLNVISKSGTTTEPAIAFRVLKKFLQDKYGVQESKNRIYCTTDKNSGALLKMSEEEGYQTFVIPENVGGRFSVLTPVGILPIAVCGADVDKILAGALQAHDDFNQLDLEKNSCYKYAAIRNILYRKNKKIEMLASYEPRFAALHEWFKQLFGESEGKNLKGLFPTSAVFSTDLHSLGQFIQDGSHILFETVLMVDHHQHDLVIQNDPFDLDGLNFLEGKSISYINEKAFQGTVLAHVQGDVPNVVLRLEKIDEFNLGYLFFFFQKACAISALVLGVNPFDQPGVESYKKNMFALLEKPGYQNLGGF